MRTVTMQFGKQWQRGEINKYTHPSDTEKEGDSQRREDCN